MIRFVTAIGKASSTTIDTIPALCPEKREKWKNAAMLETPALRINTVRQEQGLTLQFEVKALDGSWRTVLSNQAECKQWPWDKHTRTAIEDLDIRPSYGSTDPVFTEATLDEEGALVLCGARGVHQLEERIALVAQNHLSVTVTDTITGPPVFLERLMSHFYFVPDDRAMGYALPLDFAWLPGLHDQDDHVAGDCVFRSPAVIVVAHGMYAAIIPDLDALNRRPDLPHALDLRSWKHPGSGEVYGLPRLSYGICACRPDGHVFTAADGSVSVQPGEHGYRFDLLIGCSDNPHSVLQMVTEWLWLTYGRRYLADIRPQVLPFEEYGRRYTYVHELGRSIKPATPDDETRYGFNNVWRRGANFHAWENDLHTGFGVLHYGHKWSDDRLRKYGKGMLGLALSSPTTDGAFPCIYNFESRSWEGSHYWTSWSAHPYDGYDLQSMGVSAWWMLYWRERFPELDAEHAILDRVSDFCRFLVRAQLSGGAIPTYYDAHLRPMPQLKEAAPTAIGGAVLAKTALITGDADLRRAAILAGEFLIREILPRTAFFDFELYYSCSPKPLHWVDPLNGIPPVNTLALQWAADHLLALFRLTGEAMWLRHGETCLSLLSLFQQVWAPNRFGPAYLFGGFGVMNHDGEWNDGRQSRVVPTYADYYDTTGNLEYLERAVAACRASFAGMDMIENHANGINAYCINKAEGIAVETGTGYSPESLMHGAPRVLTGEGGGWTGFNWGPGGGLGASAYLEWRFGAVWVDGESRTVVPIDGVIVEVVQWDESRLELNIASALEALTHPCTGARPIKVKFGRLPMHDGSVTVNGHDYGNRDCEALSQGLDLTI